MLRCRWQLASPPAGAYRFSGQGEGGEGVELCRRRTAQARGGPDLVETAADSPDIAYAPTQAKRPDTDLLSSVPHGHRSIGTAVGQ